MTKTRTLRLNSDDRDTTSRAVEVLKNGGLVALPTETVYGLAVDAANEAAVQALYAAKGRPSNNPLICHVASPEMAARYVTVSEAARVLMDAFWPGPLTIVLPIQPEAQIAPSVRAGLTTLAVRNPQSGPMRRVIDALGRPVAAPSANRSGRLSPTTADDVLADLDGRIEMAVDAGAATLGIESTIVGVDSDQITLLRPGSITPDAITEATGYAVHARNTRVISAPGQLESHYAPNAPVRLNAASAGPDEVLVGFGAIKGDLTLSASGDLEEAAAKLYATLRAADRLGRAAIAIAPLPDTGIGLAINDRLKRAAAPRPTE